MGLPYMSPYRIVGAVLASGMYILLTFGRGDSSQVQTPRRPDCGQTYSQRFLNFPDSVPSFPIIMDDSEVRQNELDLRRRRIREFIETNPNITHYDIGNGTHIFEETGKGVQSLVYNEERGLLIETVYPGQCP